MITGGHLLHLRRKQKVRSAHVRIRYMRYAAQVTTDTEKTTYYPGEIDRMKTHNSTSKNRNQNRKIKNQKGKREKKVQFRQACKKSRKETHKIMRMFAQIAGSHATRGA